MKIMQDVRDYAAQKERLSGNLGGEERQVVVGASSDHKISSLTTWIPGDPKELDEASAVEAGMQEMSEQFKQAGAEIYVKA